MFGFGIGKGDAKRFFGTLKAIKGYVGIIDHPQGLLMVFETENDAKIARNIMEYNGCEVGRNIFEVTIKESE